MGKQDPILSALAKLRAESGEYVEARRVRWAVASVMEADTGLSPPPAAVAAVMSRLNVNGLMADVADNRRMDQAHAITAVAEMSDGSREWVNIARNAPPSGWVRIVGDLVEGGVVLAAADAMPVECCDAMGDVLTADGGGGDVVAIDCGGTMSAKIKQRTSKADGKSAIEVLRVLESLAEAGKPKPSNRKLARLIGCAVGQITNAIGLPEASETARDWYAGTMGIPMTTRAIESIAICEDVEPMIVTDDELETIKRKMVSELPPRERSEAMSKLNQMSTDKLRQFGEVYR